MKAEINFPPIVITLVVVLLANNSPVNAQILSEVYNIDLFVNQAGYLPNAHKTCILPKSHHRDFSEVTEEGTYYILSDTLRSSPFRISNNVYVSGHPWWHIPSD